MREVIDARLCGPDRYPPRVALVDPPSSFIASRSGQVLTVEAAVYDEGTIARLELLLDGVPAGMQRGPWFDLEPERLAPGQHELAVRAVDAAGNEGASTIQRISIVHSIPLTPTIGTVEIDALSDGWLRVTAAADPRGGQLTVVAGSDVITAPITSDATTVFVPTGAEALGAATLWGVPDRG